MPDWAREGLDTDDLVQETFLRTLRKINDFQPRHSNAFTAYIRQILRNRISDEVQKKVREAKIRKDDPIQGQAALSPLDQAIGQEAVGRYEAALERLEEIDRQAILSRIELEMSYEEVALELGKPTPDAARMAVKRALVRLAKEMGHEK